MKNIAILGSTGSVGTQTLDVVDKYPRKFRVVALLANRNIELLRKQIKKFVIVHPFAKAKGQFMEIL